MRSVILKYPLETEINKRQYIEIPQSGNILKVDYHEQDKTFYAWVKCPYDSFRNFNDCEDKASQTIAIFPTSEEGFDDAGLTHLNTFQIKGGELVFHAFIETENG